MLETRQVKGLLGLVLAVLREPAGGELGPPALGRPLVTFRKTRGMKRAEASASVGP